MFKGIIIIIIMRIFKALSHTKSLPVGRFNFSNPTIKTNVNTPTNIEVNHYNDPKTNSKKSKIVFDDLSTKELQQLRLG